MKVGDLKNLFLIYSTALQAYQDFGKTDYDAGVAEGLKRAIIILGIDIPGNGRQRVHKFEQS